LPTLTTPETIRTLQRKLYRKAKQEPACRFHALYDKVYRADILEFAYRLVRANKGSAGMDGVTFEVIEENEGASAFIAELEEALRTKTYKPDPVKRVMIPKSDGSQRPLGIPTIRDRVAQMAAKLVIEPIFEADFCETSYGFRPKKSAHDAVDDVVYSKRPLNEFFVNHFPVFVDIIHKRRPGGYTSHGHKLPFDSAQGTSVG
jgi:RNA-directed DNA polymerase